MTNEGNEMTVQDTPSFYDRLGGVYNIATVIDDLIDRVMADNRLNANPRVDEAHHRVSPAGFKYYVTEMLCGAEFVESKWVGRELRIGDDVVLEITDHCPRCIMTTLPQGDLPMDNGILRTAARHNEVHVGVYGEVRRAGSEQRGDPVALG